MASCRKQHVAGDGSSGGPADVCRRSLTFHWSSGGLHLSLLLYAYARLQLSLIKCTGPGWFYWVLTQALGLMGTRSRGWSSNWCRLPVPGRGSLICGPPFFPERVVPDPIRRVEGHRTDYQPCKKNDFLGFWVFNKC